MTTLVFGSGCPFGTSTASVIASLSFCSVTFVAFVGSTPTATPPAVVTSSLTFGVVFDASDSFTGTSISSFDPSGYVTSTTTTFLPAFPSFPSTISPSFLTTLVFGSGCPFGTSTASVIAFLSASATLGALDGSTLTGTPPASVTESFTFGVAFAASVPSTGTSTTSLLPSP